MVLGLFFISAGDVMAIEPNQVFAYNSTDFQGTPQQYNGAFSRDVMDGGYDDEYESIIVGKDMKVTLYSDQYQQGFKIVLYPGEYRNLRMESELRYWNDEVSSLKIEKLSDPDLPLIKLIYGENGGLTQMIGLDGTDEFKNEHSLLLNDRVTSAEIPAAYKVTFYEDKEYGGKKNSEPISGRTVNMKELGLNSKVSSIKIEWNKFKLTKVEMVKTSTKPRELDTFSMPMGADTECHNNSSAKLTCKKELRSTYNATATTNWQNSTTVGITATTTVKGEAGVAGVASSSVEASLALSIANEFAFGKSEAKSLGQEVADDVEVEVPAGGAVGFTLDVKPVEIDYDVTYTYSSVDDNGNPDGKNNKVIKGKMTVKSATATTAVSRDLKPGSSPAPAAQPNPSEQGYMAQAWEWIKQRPCRLYEFFGGKDPAWMCGGTNDSGTNANTNSNTNSNTAVQPTSNSNSVSQTNTSPSPTSSKSNADRIIGSWKGDDDTITFDGDKNMSSLLGNKKYKYSYEVVNENTVELTTTDPKRNSVVSIVEATIAFEDNDNTLVLTAGGTTSRLKKVSPA